MMYREMYWASEGYLWEMVQRGNIDINQVEKDFSKLILEKHLPSEGVTKYGNY